MIDGVPSISELVHSPNLLILHAFIAPHERRPPTIISTHSACKFKQINKYLYSICVVEEGVSLVCGGCLGYRAVVRVYGVWRLPRL